MVCESPDPPEGNNYINPPAANNLPTHGLHDSDESDDDLMPYEGYQQLPQGPDEALPHTCSSEEEMEDENGDSSQSHLPPIVPVDLELAKEVWSSPRNDIDSIQLDNERAQQVMSAMANFTLPHTSIPEWARCVSEEQWKEELKEKINNIKCKR